jgi:hypothetical protein
VLNSKGKVSNLAVVYMASSYTCTSLIFIDEPRVQLSIEVLQILHSGRHQPCSILDLGGSG